MNKKESNNNLKFDLIPCVLSRISAGFPSPADDYIENNLSLSELLIKNHLSTFLMKASGDSMIEVGINHNDILLIRMDPIKLDTNGANLEKIKKFLIKIFL